MPRNKSPENIFRLQSSNNIWNHVDRYKPNSYEKRLLDIRDVVDELDGYKNMFLSKKKSLRDDEKREISIIKSNKLLSNSEKKKQIDTIKRLSKRRGSTYRQINRAKTVAENAKKTVLSMKTKGGGRRKSRSHLKLRPRKKTNRASHKKQKLRRKTRRIKFIRKRK